MIVEDEMFVRMGIKMSVDWEKLGIGEVKDYENGQQAWEAYQQERPDLILTDLKMPVMDGIDLIKATKDKKMDCEFLVISNYEDFNYVRTALVLGASDYILKVSISPEELTSQLQKVKTKLEDKQAKKEPEDSVETSLLHQERHAAWREFFTPKSYPLENLLSITGIDVS